MESLGWAWKVVSQEILPARLRSTKMLSCRTMSLAGEPKNTSCAVTLQGAAQTQARLVVQRLR